MKSAKLNGKLLIACIALISVTALLKAGYYQPDLFPIGLTGINGTGGTPPYSNAGAYPQWTWDGDTNSEQSLIFDLGINCIGCQDAKAKYLLDFDGTENDYLHKVCMQAGAPGSDSAIYILMTGYYVDSPKVSLVYSDTTWYGDRDSIASIHDSVDCCHASYDTVGLGSRWGHHGAASMFRSPYRGSHRGFGDMYFSAYTPSGGGCSSRYNCHGDTDGSAWNTWDGDDVWRAVADTALMNFHDYFDTHNEIQYVWGYNLISEDPAVYRHGTYSHYPNDAWRGCWAAVHYIFRGKDYRDERFPLLPDSTEPYHNGIRGIEDDSLVTANRMIFAKAAISVWHRGNFNIFASLPDIDVAYSHPHGFVQAIWNYGQQDIFDWWLYGDPAHPDAKAGRHNDAIYFQKYGNTPGGPSGQKRRWISTLCLEWKIYKDDITKASARRPCPPEIRCATYLSLSRGAKGILFHPWSYNFTVLGNTILNPSDIAIPSQTIDTSKTWNHGLRDAKGYPMGEGGPHDYTHYLNGGAPDAPFWANRTDSTYYYLKTYFIPELKALGPVLVNLDWVNAYSLKSTASGKTDPCPHMYVKSISGADYVDLGFFNDRHDAASEYFMVVNREGIADMTSRTLIITLDGACWPPSVTSLQVTDMADTLNPRTINRTGSVFQFTQTFEPGEGKLYRVKATNGSIPRKLNLIGEWRNTYAASDYMGVLNDDDGPGAESQLGYAKLDWRWLKDKPASLEAMQLWFINGSPNQSWEGAFRLGYPPFPDMYTHWWGMTDSVTSFVEVGEHPDGDSLWPDEFGIGTQSNTVRVVHPEHDPGGCPDLYTYMDRDTSLQYGYAFLENNTILPHSEQITQMDDDYLRLDALNSEPDYYYMALVENDYQKTYLDMVKLWVVDHPENTGVVTSADDSIYCYSDEIGPETCTDASQSDQLDKILWEDTTSYGGIGSAYLDVSFDDPGWSEAGLMVTVGMRGYPQPPDKDYYSVPSEPASGTYDSLGSAYGRMNCSQWVIDVSECDSFRFRVFCRGDDTCFIDRIALVKLEDDYDITEAELDSAVHYNESGTPTSVKPVINAEDTLTLELEAGQQISLRFDKVDTSTSYPIRDYVFQSRGWYFSPSLQRSSIGEIDPLVFDLEVAQVAPLSRVAMVNYSVPLETYVKIAAYDVAGRLVINLVDGKVQPGRYSEKWMGQDGVGRSLASGVYFIKMMTDEYEETNKILILE